MLPRYLRFARAVTMVSITLPAPVLAADLIAGCEGGGDSSGLVGTRPGPEDAAPQTGSAPAPGVVVGPTTGVQPCDHCEDLDSGADADAQPQDSGADADSGGPARGTPELPPSWRRG